MVPCVRLGIKGKVIPLQARCGPEGGRGIALLFRDRGTRRGRVVSSTTRPHFTPGKDPVHILQEAGWASGPVWTGGKSRPHCNFFYLHPFVLPYYCYIPFHTLFKLPRIRRTGRNLYCLLHSHRFITLHHYPPCCFVNVCHCRLTLRSLLHVIAVYLMLQCHRHSPRPS